MPISARSPLTGDAADGNATSFDSNSDSESIVPLNELHLAELQVNRAPLMTSSPHKCQIQFHY